MQVLILLLTLLVALPVGFILAAVVYAAWYQWRYEPRLVPSGPLRSHVPLRDGTLRVYVTSDVGTAGPGQYALAERMERHCRDRPADALLITGDCFYLDGVQSLQDEQWQTKIERPYGQGVLGQVPIYPVFGNHDFLGNRQAELDYSKVSSQWRMPHRFYTVTFGNLVKLIAFDSNFTDLWFNPERGALDFLIHELKHRGDARWVVVMAHHPVISSSARGGPRYRGGYYGWFIKRFLCGKAHLHLNGHAHHLEHRRLPGCSTHFFLSGAGGDDFHPVKSNSDAHYLRSDSGFLELTFHQETIEARFILLDGSTDYHTVLRPEDF